MITINNLGWDIKSIYEPVNQHDLMEAEAFYIAFARERNIDGHNILCVMTPVKEHRYNLDGVEVQKSVLIVKDADMRNIRLNTSLRVDGRLYVIVDVSRPAGDIIRIELEGHS